MVCVILFRSFSETVSILYCKHVFTLNRSTKSVFYSAGSGESYKDGILSGKEMLLLLFRYNFFKVNNLLL